MKYELLLSVIIPVYNVQKHLEGCLDSLTDGQNKDVEFILVDDGSTDGSPAICDSYADKFENVKVIHKKNGGLARARNTGIEAAKGAYVTFFDSDDFADEGYSNFIISELKSRDDIYAFAYNIDYTETSHTTVCELEEGGGLSAPEAVRRLERKGALNSSANKVYSRDMLDSEPALRFRPDSEPGEDLIFNTQCFSRAKTVTILNKPFYHWVRRGEDTLANRFREDLYERNLFFIDCRNKMYSSLGMDKTDYDLLCEGNLGYIFVCVPNMYRPGHKFKRKKRIEIYRALIDSEDVRSWVENSAQNNSLYRQFASLYKTRSPFIIDKYYLAVMGFRNIFDSTWKKLRRKIG